MRFYGGRRKDKKLELLTDQGKWINISDAALLLCNEEGDKSK